VDALNNAFRFSIDFRPAGFGAYRDRSMRRYNNNWMLVTLPRSHRLDVALKRRLQIMLHDASNEIAVIFDRRKWVRTCVSHTVIHPKDNCASAMIG
jgi:hypothetical protein